MREARGGVLVLGGGFAGGYVARLLGKRGATIVSPENFMLYTPMLPEAASGTLEPRHVVVPLRQMCPHAELLLARVTAIDEERRVATIERPDGGADEVRYDAARRRARRGRADAARPRARRARTRLQGPRRRDPPPQPRPARAGGRRRRARRGHGARRTSLRLRRRRLRGRRGARGALRPRQGRAPLVSEAARRPQRWVLVDAAPKILAEIPTRLGEYAARELARRGVEIRTSTTLESLAAGEATLSDGERIPTHTLVWTAGVRAHPLLALRPAARRARSRPGRSSSSGSRAASRVWALGDCAAVPNGATPDHVDPPTCQHALRQARRLAKNLSGTPQPYAYRMLGQVATLGRYKGIADVMGLRAPRLPRLVRHPQLPPLPAAAVLPQAARRRRLDDLAVLPPRHRRALDARPPAPARRMNSSRSTALRVRTPRLELRLPTEAELVELYELAAAGIHPPEEMPFSVAWTDDLSREGFLAYHHAQARDAGRPSPGRSTSAPGSTASSPASRGSVQTAFAEQPHDRDRLLARHPLPGQRCRNGDASRGASSWRSASSEQRPSPPPRSRRTRPRAASPRSSATRPSRRETLSPRGRPEAAPAAAARARASGAERPSRSRSKASSPCLTLFGAA